MKNEPRSQVNVKKWFPTALLALFAIFFLMSFRAPRVSSLFDVNNFAQLPVLNGGRLKPLDSIARTALLEVSGKQSFKWKGESKSAIEWLLDVLFDDQKANAYPVFEIDDPDVLGTMNIQQTRQRTFSFNEISPHMADIEKLSNEANGLKPEQRSRFQTAIVNLSNKLMLYQRLENTLQVAGDTNAMEGLQHFQTILVPLMESHMKDPMKGTSKEKLSELAAHLQQYQFIQHVAEFFPVMVTKADSSDETWIDMGQAIMNRRFTTEYHPAVYGYAAMADGYRSHDPMKFNQALTIYRQWLLEAAPATMSQMTAEFAFNYVQPFLQSMVMYLAVFCLVFISWLVWPETLNKTAFALLLFAFAVHTGGLITRIILQGRPPVTNLYSSAIFVGWVAVLLGIVLERIFRRGLGSAVAATIGFITLIIAHHLAAQGDTLEMMRAVLDSNFWLATHVVCITIGYGSTFIAGFLGILYIFRRSFDPHWDNNAALTLERMAYGIVCFATLFSFLGTILGGIWADQSWGRFWGWDPKENGALMIVLWNAFILHARWGKVVSPKWIMALTVVGNIVTSLSWFGVNMLGIGLHSYGFMDKAFLWLMIFVANQVAIIAMAWIPKRTT